MTGTYMKRKSKYICCMLLTIMRQLHLGGWTTKSHLCDQFHAVKRERWRFMLCICGFTILKSTAKSSLRASRASGKSFTKRGNKSGPISDHCDTLQSIGMEFCTDEYYRDLLSKVCFNPQYDAITKTEPLDWSLIYNKHLESVCPNLTFFPS